jgi:hypothetical protein
MSRKCESMPNETNRTELNEIKINKKALSASDICYAINRRTAIQYLKNEDRFSSLHSFAELLCRLCSAVNDNVASGYAPLQLLFEELQVIAYD